MSFDTAPIPSSSAVAAGVTLLVSAWFAAASGAILTDNHSTRLIETVRSEVAEQNVVPTSASPSSWKRGARRQRCNAIRNRRRAFRRTVLSRRGNVR